MNPNYAQKIRVAAAGLANAAERGDYTFEVRYQRLLGTQRLPVMYRARMLRNGSFIVEHEDGPDWRGTYITDDPRHAATVLHGATRYPSTAGGPVVTARETVTTYADGWGRWYARVNFAEPVAEPWVERNYDRIRARARRAIRREIEARQNERPEQVRVEVVEDMWAPRSPDHMNLHRHLTFAERGL